MENKKVLRLRVIHCQIGEIVKSITRCVFKSARGPISWSSKKQATIAVSSTNAKAKALSQGIGEAIWLCILFTKIHGCDLDSITIFCDNQSILKAAQNLVLHKQLKLIELWLHFIGENVLTRVVDIIYIVTCDHIADFFTKPLEKHRFVKLRGKLGIQT